MFCHALCIVIFELLSIFCFGNNVNCILSLYTLNIITPKASKIMGWKDHYICYSCLGDRPISKKEKAGVQNCDKT